MKSIHLIALVASLLIWACAEERVPMDGKIFLEAVSKIEGMETEQRIGEADKLLQSVEKAGTPLYVNDTTAILVVRYSGDSLLMMGDMNLWQAEAVFTKIPDTDLQYFTGVYESNARLQYWLQTDPKAWPVVDTLNPYLVSNGFGLMSELAMPGYEYSPLFQPFRDGHKSSEVDLDEHILAPGVLPYEHLVHVWMPPHQEGGIAGSIYFLDGLGYISYAHMPAVLGEMMAQGQIPPLALVFVTPPNWEQSGDVNRETEYGLNPVFVEYLAEELVPMIESMYSIGTGPETRLIVGDSYGGLGAHYIGFTRPDVFGLAYSQSGYMSFKNDSLISMFEASAKLDLKLALDCGTYETQVGGGALPSMENDFLAANRRMKATLLNKGYDIHYSEFPEGHTWGNWRQHLTDILPWFFGSGKPTDRVEN